MSRLSIVPLVAAVLACSSPSGSGAPESAGAQKAGEGATSAPATASGPLPTLIVTQARFEKVGGKIRPRPATLWLLRKEGAGWRSTVVEDPASNVFHKGIAWRGGILTIGAMKARLTHWKKDGERWSPTVLWERAWGGKFDRLRDLEIGDLDGDGVEELVLATHDMGVVAVGMERDGGWTFVESEPRPDTFVHEVEIGDVDGDGRREFYATPSDRNRSSGASQRGGVVRYDFVEGALRPTPVVHWEESHAKEILVADADGDGREELYAVREAHVVVDPVTNAKERLEPVKIVRLVPGSSGWEERVVATLDDDQCRFLTAADIDGDGAQELLAAGKKSGLWRLEKSADGAWERHLIDDRSGGFEHAIHTADLDGDGRLELYVAADDQGELRVYTWNGERFERATIAPIPPRTLTWNIQDGRF